MTALHPRPLGNTNGFFLVHTGNDDRIHLAAYSLFQGTTQTYQLLRMQTPKRFLSPETIPLPLNMLVNLRSGIRSHGLNRNGKVSHTKSRKLRQELRQAQPVCRKTELNIRIKFPNALNHRRHGSEIFKRISGPRKSDNRQMRHMCPHLPITCDSFIYGKNTAAYAGTAFIHAVVLPQAIITLYVAGGRNRQVHPRISSACFVKARVAAFLTHVLSPSTVLPHRVCADVHHAAKPR